MDYFLSETFSRENLRYVLQLTVLIGGYILLRPLIELGFRRLFATQPQQPKVARQKSLAEEMVLEDSNDEEREEYGAGACDEWGSGMRRRQSKFMEYWEAEQARRLEEEELEDIKDLLQD